MIDLRLARLEITLRQVDTTPRIIPEISTANLTRFCSLMSPAAKVPIHPKTGTSSAIVEAHAGERYELTSISVASVTAMGRSNWKITQNSTAR